MKRESRQDKKERRSEGRRGRRAEPMIEPLAPSAWWARWILAVLVASAAVVVYWNTLQNGFVSWDDGDYVYQNPLLQGGLGSIWGELFKEDKHEQYYPLVFTSYWIEHKFVGVEPRLYHATQIALHAVNSMLWLFVLRWLGVSLPVATLTAALFAVHPVNVASVAWVTERKNTLSGLFFLLSLLLYLQHRRSGGAWRYWAALGSFQLALFAKTAVVVLPALLIVSDRVLDRRWTKLSFRRAVPFLALAFLMAIITIGVEGEQSKSGRPVDPMLRPLIACAALVHYVGKVVWPANLLPLYPRWPESFHEYRYWLSAAALIVVAILLLRFRKKLGDRVLWCVALFLLPLLPALGLKHFNLMQFSFVADHLMYLSAPGLFLAAALVVERFVRSADHLAVGLGRGAVIVAALAALGWLTVRQNHVWHDTETFWVYTLAGNPDCVPGNINLGNYYKRNKECEKALPYYRAAARLLPDHLNTPRFYAQCCRELGRHEEALQWYQEALQRAEKKSPRFVAIHLEYAGFLRSLKRSEEARAAYETVLRKDPRNRTALLGLEQVTRATGTGEGAK
ncbi:MAG TPA: tetratricopeptide repeat protein [Phycisphaerae bacterium]|nr:tetratricopeptide repeat protein [Phycisphaerae bacterium]